MPRATLHQQRTGEALPPLRHPQACDNRETADALALRLAKRWVRDALHQG